MRLRILAICTIFCLTSLGCATHANRKASAKNYTSDIPSLKVDFASHIRDQKDFGRDKWIQFSNRRFKPVWVELDYIRSRDKQIDYFYSLEQIASNGDFCFLGTAHFSGHKWVKVAKENDRGYLMCGYLTRKDKWIIFIHNATPLTNSELESYRRYQKTLQLSETEQKLIDLLFNNLDEVIVSIH
jgi:hypothetical protein